MRRFELAEPSSLKEACALLSDNAEAKVIAGGTALLTLIKHGIFVPKTLVNLKKIKAASDISYDAQTGLRVGALAAIYDIEGIAVGAATLSGVGRSVPCGGEYSDSQHGHHRRQSGAWRLSIRSAHSAGGAKRRRRTIEPCRNPADEIVRFFERQLRDCAGARRAGFGADRAPPAESLSGTYTKFTTGSSEERPCVGVAALTTMESGVCAELRLVVGAVSPKPVRLEKAESMARGEKLTSELIERIAADASSSVEPIDDLRGTVDYKRHLVHVLVRRALERCGATLRRET